MDKPGLEELLELEAATSKFWQPAHQKFEEDEEYYELNFVDKLNIPEEFKASGVVLPTGRDHVDSFADHVDIANARVKVNKLSTTDIDAESAEMMRKFYTGLIYRTNVESDISPWRVAAKHYPIYGMAVFKTVWDADRWPDKPKQKSSESDEDYNLRLDEWRYQTHESLPIVIQAVNPLNFFGDPSYGGRRYVFEKHPMLIYDIRKKWPKWGNPENKGLDKESEYISYWDNAYRCEWIDKEPLLKGGVVKHNYGLYPYVVIDAGLGNISSDGKLEKRYVGLLRYVKDLLVAESRSFSLNDVVLSRGAMPWYLAEGANAALLTEIVQRFGVVNPLPDGVTLKEMAPQVPPDALRTHMFIISDYLSAHSAPRSTRGLSETGVRSGVDRREIAATAGLRFAYSTEAFKNGTAKVLSNCARIYKNIVPGDIRVWSHTPTDEFDMVIDKNKMKEPFTCFVEFAPYSEEDEYRRHDDLERLYKTGITTKRWTRQQMSNVDALAMEEEDEVEKLANDPIIQGIFSQYAAQKLTEALAKRQQAEALKGGEPLAPPPPPGAETMGAPPPPGAGAMPGPPGGNMTQNIRPVPTSAEQAQQALAGMRSKTSVNPIQGFMGGGTQ